MKTSSHSVRFDENAPCDRCGRFGAHLFDGERLCVDCYEARGSCCPECGADDLWGEVPDEPAPGAKPEQRP